jgi:hypothetical protein
VFYSQLIIAFVVIGGAQSFKKRTPAKSVADVDESIVKVRRQNCRLCSFKDTLKMVHAAQI